MRYILIFGGLICLTISFLNIGKTFKEREVYFEGKIVQIKIVKLPEDCGRTKARKLFHFEYNQHIYTKWVGYDVCEKKIGDIIEMKHLDKYEDVFVFKNEATWFSLAILFFLMIMGFLGIIMGLLTNYFKKMKSNYDIDKYREERNERLKAIYEQRKTKKKK